MIKIQVFGKASQKIVKVIEVDEDSLNSKISLMDFLHKNNIPVASSCLGEGICRKCVVNIEMLSCQVELSKFISQSHIQSNANQNLIKISIDYL